MKNYIIQISATEVSDTSDTREETYLIGAEDSQRATELAILNWLKFRKTDEQTKILHNTSN